ncbi:Alpha-tocopherol transfer protein-like [Porphyridium purpureum]|uniref:Alpha-tocopherol transfer protein-like n=1 Tax=Porphyridium purpureum TaxID=35688 RepID=A0A5J4YKS4_PORPP|nr:Alpha-tocopherol transfer protein-like [Porphyridium purpureum]|eukprot:POR3327..scf244_11
MMASVTASDVAALRGVITADCVRASSPERACDNEGSACVCELDDADLQRFLVARRRDVDAATELVRQERTWKSKYLPVMRTASLEALLAKHKVVHGGRTANGDAVVVVYVRKHDKNEEDCVHLNTQLAVVAIEAGMARSESGQLLAVMDMSEFGWAQTDLAMAKRIIYLLSIAYPERLSKMILFRAWLPFRSFYALVSPFVDERSKRKVHFASELSELESLHALTLSDLPVELGGTLDTATDSDSGCWWDALDRSVLLHQATDADK